jgi:hypothetical protein
MWQKKKASLNEEADDFHQRSPSLEQLDREDFGEEWRSMWLLKMNTLVQRQDGRIHQSGPILLGIRYHQSFLAQAPHPCEIVTVLQPTRVFHPNCNLAGVMCLGVPQAGLSLDFVLTQSWFGLSFNMRKVNTLRGDILNPEAARFVRASAERFPLTEKGLFEVPDLDAPGTMPLFPGRVAR